MFLIDSSIYVFRAWQGHARGLTDTQQRPFNAVDGFADTLAYLISRHSPSHMVCAFDECLGNGIRHRLYPGYKANRPPAPEELRYQFEACKALVDAAGIRAIGSPDVEADDIIGQLAGLARDTGRPVTIVSGDKDLAQFIRDGDLYWDVGRQGQLDFDAVIRRFSIHPRQIPDWLALCGDKADNIPGIPGVGPATAVRLLRRYADLDTLFAHAADVASMKFRGAPRVSRLLVEHEATVRQARQLTGLIEDPALPVDLEELRRRPPPAADLAERLERIGFTASRARRLAARLAHDALVSELILLNKPYGVLCQFRRDGDRPTLADYITQPDIYPAGRLDRDSEGLVILTGDGRLQQRISHPRHKWPKHYWVQVEGEPDETALAQLRRGVTLRDGPTAPCRVQRLESEPDGLWPRDPPIRYRAAIPTTWLSITLTEGRNRQVRRMTAAVGCPTLRLIRESIGAYHLQTLLPGESCRVQHTADNAGANQPQGQAHRKARSASRRGQRSYRR